MIFTYTRTEQPSIWSLSDQLPTFSANFWGAAMSARIGTQYSVGYSCANTLLKGCVEVSTYSFRLRFNFSGSYRIASDATELILWDQDGLNLKLKSTLRNLSLKDAPRAAVLGEAFKTSEQARDVAEKTKRAILYWAVEQQVGIDFGDGKQQDSLTEEGNRYFERLHDCPIRLDKHGIDVFETIENVGFLDINFDAQVGKSVEALIGTFHREFPKLRYFSEKHMLASEIYTSSFFDVSQRSRFVTLVTAVEALLKPEKRDNDVQILVDEFISLTEKSIIESPVRQSITSSLNWIRYESIGRAGRTLANRLLPTHTYVGMAAGAFFTKAYALRSSLVHSGAPDEPTDIVEMANAMEKFVAHLLIASLSSETLQ